MTYLGQIAKAFELRPPFLPPKAQTGGRLHESHSQNMRRRTMNYFALGFAIIAFVHR